MSELKQRKTASRMEVQPNGNISKTTDEHPVGEVKHGFAMQLLRIFLFGIYFFGCCFFIHGAQLLGVPLWWINTDWFYAGRALNKQFFGLLITTMTQWWSPTTVRISGDKSVAGLLRQDESGMVSLDFDTRALVMANHQLYTDWLYMWWAAYTNSQPMHGHIYIILKATLKWIPIFGIGMQLYGFIFMNRNWAADEASMRSRLTKLKTRTSGPMSGQAGKAQLDPMWLLIYPEGTNLSRNTKRESAEFSAKSGKQDYKHQVIPRTKGLQLCLQELRDSVDYLYDCTIGYEPVGPNGFGSEIYTLRSVYFQGRPPHSVNMHWRRLKIKDLPLDDHDQFAEWLFGQWRIKDELLEGFYKTGKFPADKSAVYIEGGPTDSFKTPYINTEVRPRNPMEFLQIFVPVSAAFLVGRSLIQIVNRVLPGGK